MARFIEAENLPAPQQINGQDLGGASFIAWSQGNGPLLSLLANISQLDEGTNAVLERYIRTVFIYGGHVGSIECSAVQLMRSHFQTLQ